MVDQVDGVMTEDRLEGYPRVLTYTTITGSDYLETISVTIPLIRNGVEESATYVQTYTYTGTNVTGISAWVKQP